MCVGSRTNSLAVRVCLILPVSQTAAHPTCRDTRCYPAAGAVDLGGRGFELPSDGGARLETEDLRAELHGATPLRPRGPGKDGHVVLPCASGRRVREAIHTCRKGVIWLLSFFFFRLALFSTGQFTGTLEKDGGDDKAVCDIHMLPKQVAAQFTHGT